MEQKNEIRCIGTIKKKRPDKLAKLLICESILRPLEEHLRKTGMLQREEAGLIAGYVTNDSIGVATTAIIPRTENTLAGCILPFEVTIGCIEIMDKTGQVVLAQVHTHPGRICQHSCTDDDWAFSDCPGLFSIVVPCFGRFGIRRILTTRRVAIFERLCSGQWHRLPKAEVRQRLLIVPTSESVFR